MLRHAGKPGFVWTDISFEDLARKITPVAKSIPKAELPRISTHIIRWGHANQLGPTAYPRISDRSNLKFYLYIVELKKFARTRDDKLRGPR